MPQLPTGWSHCHSTCLHSAGEPARADEVPSPVRRRELASVKQEHEAALSGMQTRCAELERELGEGRAIWGDARWPASSTPTAALLALQNCPGGQTAGLLPCCSWVLAASSHLGLSDMELPPWLWWLSGQGPSGVEPSLLMLGNPVVHVSASCAA